MRNHSTFHGIFFPDPEDMHTDITEKTSNSTHSPSQSRIRWFESLPLAGLLLGFWIELSGEIDVFHLGIGFVISLGLALGSCHFYSIAPWGGHRNRHPFFSFPWTRILFYLPWLGWQVLLSSLQLARLILSPKMNLDPSLVRFKLTLPSNTARATLANSITLTPGTVTIDSIDNEFLVHCLNEDAAQTIRYEKTNDMKSKIRDIFNKTDRA